MPPLPDPESPAENYRWFLGVAAEIMLTPITSTGTRHTAMQRKVKEPLSSQFPATSIFAAAILILGPNRSLGQTTTSTVTENKAPTAFVTFVDNGFSLAGGMPGQKSQSFRGKLFIENQLLASMEPARFVTFVLDPVKVEFTAQTWMATGPTGGAHITLQLVAGKHYFLEVRTRQAWPVTKMFGIKEISCQEAVKEHLHDIPLEASHIKATDPGVVAETSFPSCP